MGWHRLDLGDALGFTLRRRNSLPHVIGPETPIRPLKPEEAAHNLRIWAMLMVLATVGFVVSHLVVR